MPMLRKRKEPEDGNEARDLEKRTKREHAPTPSPPPMNRKRTQWENEMEAIAIQRRVMDSSAQMNATNHVSATNEERSTQGTETYKNKRSEEVDTLFQENRLAEQVAEPDSITTKEGSNSEGERSDEVYQLFEENRLAEQMAEPDAFTIQEGNGPQNENSEETYALLEENRQPKEVVEPDVFAAQQGDGSKDVSLPVAERSEEVYALFEENKQVDMVSEEKHQTPHSTKQEETDDQKHRTPKPATKNDRVTHKGAQTNIKLEEAPEASPLAAAPERVFIDLTNIPDSPPPTPARKRTYIDLTNSPEPPIRTKAPATYRVIKRRAKPRTKPPRAVRMNATISTGLGFGEAWPSNGSDDGESGVEGDDFLEMVKKFREENHPPKRQKLKGAVGPIPFSLRKGHGTRMAGAAKIKRDITRRRNAASAARIIAFRAEREQLAASPGPQIMYNSEHTEQHPSGQSEVRSDHSTSSLGQAIVATSPPESWYSPEPEPLAEEVHTAVAPSSPPYEPREYSEPPVEEPNRFTASSPEYEPREYPESATEERNRTPASSPEYEPREPTAEELAYARNSEEKLEERPQPFIGYANYMKDRAVSKSPPLESEDCLDVPIEKLFPPSRTPWKSGNYGFSMAKLDAILRNRNRAEVPERYWDACVLITRAEYQAYEKFNHHYWPTVATWLRTQDSEYVHWEGEPMDLIQHAQFGGPDRYAPCPRKECFYPHTGESTLPYRVKRLPQLRSINSSDSAGYGRSWCGGVAHSVDDGLAMDKSDTIIVYHMEQERLRQELLPGGFPQVRLEAKLNTHLDAWKTAKPYMLIPGRHIKPVSGSYKETSPDPHGDYSSSSIDQIEVHKRYNASNADYTQYRSAQTAEDSSSERSASSNNPLLAEQTGNDYYY